MNHKKLSQTAAKQNFFQKRVVRNFLLDKDEDIMLSSAVNSSKATQDNSNGRALKLEPLVNTHHSLT